MRGMSCASFQSSALRWSYQARPPCCARACAAPSPTVTTTKFSAWLLRSSSVPLSYTCSIHMFDEAGHRTPAAPSPRCAPPCHRRRTRPRARQAGCCRWRAARGADRQFIRCELRIERSIAIQLALGGQLRDLAADTALGAHGTAVERLQRMAVARTGHEATAETARTLPALWRAAQTKPIQPVAGRRNGTWHCPAMPRSRARGRPSSKA